MKPSWYLFVTTLIITALSCNPAKKSGDNASTDSTQNNASQPGTNRTTALEGTYWKLVELNGKPVTMAETQSREQHLILQASDSTVKGFGGCNGFGGNYELKTGDRIKFSKVIHTMMACDALEAENAYLKVLETADNYNLVSDTLTLNKARMAPLARFKAVHMQ
jgi:heat shock protein HslJ